MVASCWFLAMLYSMRCLPLCANVQIFEFLYVKTGSEMCRKGDVACIESAHNQPAIPKLRNIYIK